MRDDSESWKVAKGSPDLSLKPSISKAVSQSRSTDTHVLAEYTDTRQESVALIFCILLVLEEPHCSPGEPRMHSVARVVA